MSSLNWKLVVFAFAFILLIRPVTAMIPLPSKGLHLKERIAISFFGIRGMGTFFYLSFALREASFPFAKELWAVCSLVVLLSIIVHGLTATTVMDKLDSEFSQQSEVVATGDALNEKAANK
jgi:NhaP-type Na+/H+ or K+/H+ antiporter